MIREDHILSPDVITVLRQSVIASSLLPVAVKQVFIDEVDDYLPIGPRLTYGQLGHLLEAGSRYAESSMAFKLLSRSYYHLGEQLRQDLVPGLPTRVVFDDGALIDL